MSRFLKRVTSHLHAITFPVWAVLLVAILTISLLGYAVAAPLVTMRTVVPLRDGLMTVKIAVITSYAMLENGLAGDQDVTLDQIVQPLDTALVAVDTAMMPQYPIPHLWGIAPTDPEIHNKLVLLRTDLETFNHLSLERWQGRGKADLVADAIHVRTSLSLYQTMDELDQMINQMVRQATLRQYRVQVGLAILWIISMGIVVAMLQSTTNRRRAAEASLHAYAGELEQHVAERTAQLTRTNAELSSALRLKDEFLATMSHELRTPLTAILGLTEVLQEEVFGDLNLDQRRSLGTIERSSQHLLTLINDILDVSKLEAGRLELEYGPVNIEALCQSSIAMVRPQAQNKRIHIEANLGSGYTIVYADERRLKQVLVNLLSNAVKFTPEAGRIALDIQCDRKMERVIITVQDTGIGITEADLLRLFRPFTQLDSSLSRQYAGTGLGLTLVYRLMAKHNGSVTVSSRPEAGSRFAITLPWLSSPPQPLPETNGVEAGKLALLVTDDDQDGARSEEALSALGYHVEVVPDSVEAVAQARRESPDLIVLDLNQFPSGSLEAGRFVHSQTDLEAIPLIVLSALVLPGDLERSQIAGINLYLTKPISVTGLKEQIDMLPAGGGKQFRDNRAQGEHYVNH